MVPFMFVVRTHWTSVSFWATHATILLCVIEQNLLHLRDAHGIAAVCTMFARDLSPCILWARGLERALTTVCHALGPYLDDVATFNVALPRVPLLSAFFGTRQRLGRAALRGAHGIPPGFTWGPPAHANLVAAGCLWAYLELFALRPPAGTYLFFFFVLATTDEDRLILLRARGWFGDLSWYFLPCHARARLSVPRRLDRLHPA